MSQADLEAPCNGNEFGRLDSASNTSERCGEVKDEQGYNIQQPGSFPEDSMALKNSRRLLSASGHEKRLSKVLVASDKEDISEALGKNPRAEAAIGETSQPKASRGCMKRGQEQTNSTKRAGPLKLGSLRKIASRRSLMIAMSDEDTGNESDGRFPNDITEKDNEETKTLETQQAPSRRGCFRRSTSLRLTLDNEKENSDLQKRPAQGRIGALRRRLSSRALLVDTADPGTENMSDDDFVESGADYKSKSPENVRMDPKTTRRGYFGRSKSARLLDVADAEDGGQVKQCGRLRRGLLGGSSRRLLLKEPEEKSSVECSLSDDSSEKSVSSLRDDLSKMSCRSSHDDLAEKIKESRQQFLRRSQSLQESHAGTNADSTAKPRRSSMAVRLTKSARARKPDENLKPTRGRANSRSENEPDSDKNCETNIPDRPTTLRRLLSSNRLFRSKEDEANEDGETETTVKEDDIKTTADSEAVDTNQAKKRTIEVVLLFTKCLWCLFTRVRQNPAAKLFATYTMDIFFFVAFKVVSVAFWLLAGAADGVRISSLWLINQEVVRKILVAVYTQGEHTKAKKKR